MTTGAHLIELVLEVRGPLPAVEPMIGALRKRLEATGEAFARQLGTHVSKEFGSLTCTVRAVVDSDDLLHASEIALRGIRPVLKGLLVGQDRVSIHEQSLHVRHL